MLNIKHILFPFDFSERCSGAVPFVESLASRYCANVTLLAAVQPFYNAAMGDPTGETVLIKAGELLQGLTEELEHSLTTKFLGLSVARVAELGDPSQVIVDFAHANGVDLIMMPTHGYGPFRRLLLGSVTARVLHDAKCVVWTAAHVADPPCHDHLVFETALCAVDGSADSVSLLKWAGEFSKDAGATLRLVHVIPGMEGPLTSQMNAEFERKMCEQASEKIEDLKEAAGLDAPISIVSGNVADAVRREALQYQSDLVIIGRATRNEKFGRLRTQSHDIIRRSPCPVLSV